MTKFVLRLIDKDGELLGWTETQGHARGDGAIWPTGPIYIGIERDGIVAALSIHWADVNVERREQTIAVSVFTGMVFPLVFQGPLYEVGKAAGGLPPVTVRGPVTLAMPVGSLGAVGSR